jgi:hypothetical protein
MVMTRKDEINKAIFLERKITEREPQNWSSIIKAYEKAKSYPYVSGKWTDEQIDRYIDFIQEEILDCNYSNVI